MLNLGDPTHRAHPLPKTRRHADLLRGARARQSHARDASLAVLPGTVALSSLVFAAHVLGDQWTDEVLAPKAGCGTWEGALSHQSLRGLLVLEGEVPPISVPSDPAPKPLFRGPFVGLGTLGPEYLAGFGPPLPPRVNAELLGTGQGQAAEGPARRPCSPSVF